MKLYELLKGVSPVEADADPETEITSLSWDSRTVEPGALFAALPGARQDGGDYIVQALERGAAAVLCMRRPEGQGPWLTVEDPRAAFARVCANWFGHPGEELTLVAVTGTNGKTTTTHLIRELLSGVLGTRVGLIGTNHNLLGEEELPAHRTTPDCYEVQQLLRAMADGGCTHVVMEASSHALVQHRLDGLTFQVGVFTNLTQDHLDYHRTMEEYRLAKGLLFRQCRQGVLNLDDEAGRWYLRHISCPAFTYSESHDAAHLTAHNLRLYADRVEFEAVTLEEMTHICLPIPGGFSIYNALAALSAGVCLGLRLGEMAPVLARVKGVKGRIEVVPVPAPYTVIIDYAHSPDALENILTTARDFTAGRLICVFGCGGDRDRTKRPLMGAVAGALADVTVVTSDNPRTERPEAIIREILSGVETDGLVYTEPDRRRAIAWALEHGQAGDVIVLAGKGHETYQEIGGERFPLDEREVVRDWFVRWEKKQEGAGNSVPAIV